MPYIVGSEIWGNLERDANPIHHRDNIMYHGWYMAMLGEYISNTGDDRYNRQPLRRCKPVSSIRPSPSWITIDRVSARPRVRKAQTTSSRLSIACGFSIFAITGTGTWASACAASPRLRMCSSTGG